MLGTMTSRYADMAGEMLFSAYVPSVAERYQLFVLDERAEEAGQRYLSYLKLNLENKSNRMFGFAATVRNMEAVKKVRLSDNDWQPLKDQMIRAEKYALIKTGAAENKQLLEQIRNVDPAKTADNYEADLSVQNEQTSKSETEEEITELKTSDATQYDPRPGITRWLKQGLLTLVMEDLHVSEKSIKTDNCSWSASEAKKQKIWHDFTDAAMVRDSLQGISFVEQLQKGIAASEEKILLNSYYRHHFRSLCTQKKSEKTVLDYEIEYLLFGHTTDRENLESTLSALFVLRTLLNLTFLYASPEKGQSLIEMTTLIQTASVIPVVGPVIRLLLMFAWASCEAVVDDAALVRGEKVPLMKNDSSWSLSSQQLLQIGKGRGQASDYICHQNTGFTYDDYLYCLLFMISDEKKIIRMTQLIECNERQNDNPQFSLKTCLTEMKVKGCAVFQPFFWQHPSLQQYEFEVTYNYD